MNDYSFPEHSDVSDEAKDLISRILKTEPEERLTLNEILLHSFFQYPIPD